MNSTKKAFLGLVTHWPIVYMGIFLCFWLTSFFAIQSGNAMFGMFAIIFPLHALTMAACFGLTAFYLWHTVTNKALTDNERIVWLLVNLMGGVIGWPIYYWAKIAPTFEVAEA